MKRIIALSFAAMTLLAFAACASKGTDDNKQVESDYKSSLEVLDAIWEKYSDDDKFPVLGGNRDAMVENKPGAFDLNAAADLTSMLLLPTENIAALKSAASMVHMINGNTFTAAVFETNVVPETFSQILVNAANAKQFVCGRPEMMVTLKIDNYVIMAFGTDGLTETFKDYALKVEGVTLIHSGPIVFNGGNTGGFSGVQIPI